ncbi:MAG: PEP-CTERM sorting domain-containing protein [Luteolibacter sp.]
MPLVLALFATQAHCQTVINGSFEDSTGMIYNPSAIGNHYAGVTPGWDWTPSASTPAAAGVNHIHKDYNMAPTGVTGDYFLEGGNAGSLGILSQDILGFTPGQGYILYFDWGNRQDANPLRNAYNFIVSIGGESFSRSGVTDGGIINMTPASITFIAGPSGMETLAVEFLDPGDGNNSATIGTFDNFSLATVPEPSASAMLVIGLILLLKRRQR